MTTRSRARTAVVIDYGSGNLRSAEKALQTVGAPLGVAASLSADPDAVAKADHIVLPGVGAFGDCAAGLRAVDGMVDALEQRVRRDGRPFLGVCVGAQLMATRGLERGAYDGLDWIPGEVVEIAPKGAGLKVPHMGWNTLDDVAPHPVLEGLGAPAHAYFVHSFHMRAASPAHVLATADHGGAVTAIIGRENMIGTQFHPEKSQKVGLRIIENFLRWRP